MQLTWYDTNSWLIDIGGQRILLDPWLVGSLTFGNAEWLLKGDRRVPIETPDAVDVILLSQGLEDHAHPPTLQALPKDWSVVGSQKAADVVNELGYKSVTALEHGQKFVLQDRVEIWALPGAPIGPTLVENAYVITDLHTGDRLYYEPHGFHSDEAHTLDKVDVIITPIIGITILGLLPVLNGQKTTLALAKSLKPRYILPTGNAETIDYQGILTKALRLDGTLDEFRQSLQQNQLASEVLEPTVNHPIQIPVGNQSTIAA